MTSRAFSDGDLAPGSPDSPGPEYFPESFGSVLRFTVWLIFYIDLFSRADFLRYYTMTDSCFPYVVPPKPLRLEAKSA
jgi:hypothetical protein